MRYVIAADPADMPPEWKAIDARADEIARGLVVAAGPGPAS